MMAGGDARIGKTHGAKSTIIHALMNASGLPVALSPPAANREDFDEALPLPDQMHEVSGVNILGDKAYGIRKLRACYIQRGAAFTIPPC